MNEQLPAQAARKFQIFLQQGEVLRFAIFKGDLNVAVRMWDPSGRQIVDYFSFSYEPIELPIVAAASGVFVLELTSMESGTRQDQFALTLDPVRRAGPNDIKNAAAGLSIATATRLFSEWREPSLRKALVQFTEAATLATDAGIATVALMKAGETHSVLGEYKQAVERFEQAAARSVQAEQPENTLKATAEAARLHSLLGDNQKAQRELHPVLSLYSDRNIEKEKPLLKHAYALALAVRAEIFSSKGNAILSLDQLERALRQFEVIADRNGQARVLWLTGHVKNMLTQYDQAMAHFDRAHELYRETGNKSGEALTVTAKGITLTYRQANEEVIKLHREARAIFQVIGDRQSEAITLTAIGQAYQNLKNNKLALDHYEQSLELLRNGGTIDLIPATLHQIAAVYADMNKIKLALLYFQECARLSHTNGKRRTEAYALEEIAKIYARQGKHQDALNSLSKILRAHVSARDSRGQALVLNSMGNLHLETGQQKEALEAYQNALQLSDQVEDPGLKIDTLFNMARAVRANDSLEKARSYIEQSINMIENQRTTVASPHNRSSYFSGLRAHYDLYIGILMQLDTQRPGQRYCEMALLASERARARESLELLAEAGADIRQGVDPAVLKRERELQSLLAWQALNQIKNAASAERDHDQIELDKRLIELQAEREELQAQVRNESPRYQMLSRPKPLTVPDIQSQLGKDDLLLEYVLREEQSYVWAVTQTSINGFALPSKAKLEAAALEVSQLLTARQTTGAVIDEKYQARVRKADAEYYDKALALSQLLFKPVAGILGTKRLLIVTEGVLQQVSYDSLPPPDANPRDSSSAPISAGFDKPFLISDHEIVVQPSISVLAAIRAESVRDSSSRGRVAVFADPVFTSSDDRLQPGATSKDLAFVESNSPVFRGLTGFRERGGLRRLTYSSDEADMILAAASGDAWIVKGFDATRENVLADEVGHHQIVHFATHGFVDTEHPELSGIVLSMVKPDGTPVNGFLQLHDIVTLKLSADLTVLSACDTGLGKDVRGEGLVGLTRGLMFAGSRSVVASLWKVDDRATAVLMGHFYKALLQDKLPPAAALRYAKEQLRKEPAWSAPFFWAGFVLQGEYDKPIAVEPKSRIPSGMSVLLVVVLLSGGTLLFRRYYRAKA